MAWIEFTRFIPDDDSLVVAGVHVPSAVIESWKQGFEGAGIETQVEHRDGGRILYRWVDIDGNAPKPE